MADALDIVIYSPGLPHDGNTLKERSLGGSETAAIQLAKALAKKGHNVVAFTPCQGVKVDGVVYLPIESFPAYASTIPHDVCFISRDATKLPLPFKTKLLCLWVHDLALKRGRAPIAGSFWHLDQVVTVSAWQRDQYLEVFPGLPESQFLVAQNGVDLDGIQAAVKGLKRIPQKLMYGSRPERGLEAALNIMEVLLHRGSPLVLGVAGYENTVEQMRPYYESLWNRAQQLPNVQLLGPLKQADWHKEIASATAVLYPGCPGDFREVSCIIAMEAMACGTPFISADKGAIRETLAGSGVLVGNEETNPFSREHAVEMADAIQALTSNPIEWKKRSEAGLERAKQLDWSAAATILEDAWLTALTDRTSNRFRMERHLERTGDSEALRLLRQP